MYVQNTGIQLQKNKTLHYTLCTIHRFEISISQYTRKTKQLQHINQVAIDMFRHKLVVSSGFIDSFN